MADDHPIHTRCKWACWKVAFCMEGVAIFIGLLAVSLKSQTLLFIVGILHLPGLLITIAVLIPLAATGYIPLFLTELSAARNIVIIFSGFVMMGIQIHLFHHLCIVILGKRQHLLKLSDIDKQTYSEYAN